VTRDAKLLAVGNNETQEKELQSQLQVPVLYCFIASCFSVEPTLNFSYTSSCSSVIIKQSVSSCVLLATSAAYLEIFYAYMIYINIKMYNRRVKFCLKILSRWEKSLRKPRGGGGVNF